MNSQHNTAAMNNTPSVARKPKQPLSAYNLYVQLERKRILNGTDHLGLPISPEDLMDVAAEHKAKHGRRPHRKTHGKISFKDLAGIVAKRWKNLDRISKKVLEYHAKIEKEEYRHLNEAYKKTQEYQMELQAQLQDKLQESSTAVVSERVNIMPNFSFHSPTVALLQQPIGYSSHSQEQHVVYSANVQAYPACVQASPSSQEWKGQWISQDPLASANPVAETTSTQDEMLCMSNFHWDVAALAKVEPESPVVGCYQEQSDEWDLEVMKEMIDFHSFAFPESSMSDLLDTAYLNQADFFES